MLAMMMTMMVVMTTLLITILAHVSLICYDCGHMGCVYQSCIGVLVMSVLTPVHSISMIAGFTQPGIAILHAQLMCIIVIL